MTIPKNTNKAKRIIETARNIMCYSLDSGFIAQPLTDKPVVWGGEIVNHQHTRMIEVSQSEYLARKLNSRHVKLTAGENGHYTLHVHSNLWYSFEAVQS